MHVEVKDPNMKVILSKYYASEGRFTFTSHSPGEHLICLHSNSTRWSLWAGGKLVSESNCVIMWNNFAKCCCPYAGWHFFWALNNSSHFFKYFLHFCLSLFFIREKFLCYKIVWRHWVQVYSVWDYILFFYWFYRNILGVWEMPWEYSQQVFVFRAFPCSPKLFLFKNKLRLQAKIFTRW